MMLILFAVCFLATASSRVPCGPFEQCTCSSHTMECINTNSTLEEICERIPSKTYSLCAKKNNFGEIQRDDFNMCKQLTELHLASNNISFRGYCTFCNLENLKLLDLSKNSISFGPNTAYTKQFPIKLKLLKLNGNTAGESTDYPYLSYLEQLTELHIDGLYNKTFPNSYRTMHQLKTVVMSGLSGNCNLRYFTNETVKHLVNVVLLNISGCNIVTIQAGAFEQLNKLQVLDVSENRQMGYKVLRNISYGLQFTNIKSLNISKATNTFARAAELRMRDICYLWNTSLNEAVMNSNRMETVEKNAIILLPKTLKVLQVQDNIFTFGPYLLQLGCMPSIEEVDGSFQNLAHDPRLFDKEPQQTVIKEPDNKDCPFSSPEFLYKLSQNRKYCHFFEPGKRIFIRDYYPLFPDTVKRFNFASSGMQYNITLPVIMIPLRNNVEYLDVSGNILYGLVGPLGPFPNLKYLDLSKNYCSFIGLKFFNGALRIENLKLQQNYVGLIFQTEPFGSHVFDNLKHVKTLNLSSNIISVIPTDTFSPMLSLETLDLSVNNIEIWNCSVRRLHNLLNLNLQSNFFQTLPNELTSKLEENALRLNKSFYIDMKNNAIKINCENHAFLRWMVKNRKHFKAFGEYSFHDSSGSRISADGFIKNVENLDKTCRSYTLEIVFGSTGVSTFLAVLLGGFIYKNRWNLKYLLRMTKIRHFGYRRLQEFQGREFDYDAFISYANENSEFVLGELIPRLENKDFKLCYHEKDFLPGSCIADNILAAITKSRLTIVVLSEAFLRSEWCLYEFHMARMDSIYSRVDSESLLVVMYENISPRNMSTEMLDWIRRNTYIEFTTDEQGQLLFWDSLFRGIQI